MSEYQRSYDAQHSDQQGVSLLTVYKAFAGTVLIVIGVVIGLYTVITAFDLVRGDDPPGMISRFAKPVAAQLIENAEQNARQPIDLSPDLKQIVLYALVFLLLALNASIATSLIRAGAQLMHGDAAEALTQLAQRLKKSS